MGKKGWIGEVKFKKEKDHEFGARWELEKASTVLGDMMGMKSPEASKGMLAHGGL